MNNRNGFSQIQLKVRQYKPMPFKYICCMDNVVSDKERIQQLLDEFLDLTEEYDAAVRAGASFSVLEEMHVRIKKVQQELYNLKKRD
jgi:hypothetical protein